ncbi:MAG: acylneuraminate cytidylyltransferase family protein [Alphaproteobacteria bacterium]|nr:acylneuraminate cytidylyltransferase family protein [Alphaproteobacteria bacterium]
MRICTICARGGSKGIPGKNLHLMHGKPLIGHSVRHALDSHLFDIVAISSDSEAILKAAASEGDVRLVRRPAELASDQADKTPVMRHAVEAIEAETGLVFQTMVDLDATSPLRQISDIQACIDLIETQGHDNVLTVMPARRSPYFNQLEQNSDGHWGVCKPPATAVTGRQGAPATYDMNASIYAWSRASFMAGPTLFNAKTGVHIMPLEHSWDIDEPIDLEIVTFLMERNAGKI